MRILRLASLILPGILGACSGTDVLNALVSDEGLIAQTDLTYGPDPRLRYDLYQPRHITDDAPLLIFVHGGSWDTGSKDLYPFLGRALAQEGVAVAIPNYRLAPDHVFPSFVEDIAEATRHLHAEHANRPIFLMGHSAGAQIAALVTLDPRFLAPLDPAEAIAGFIGISGPYDFLPLTEDRYKHIFPEATRAASQVVNVVRGGHPPVLLLHGTADETVLPANSQSLHDHLVAAQSPVALRFYQGKGHIGLLPPFVPVLSWLAPVKADIMAFLAEPRSADGTDG